jgi:hypothetical protein
MFPCIDGPDANTEAGVCGFGFQYPFRYVSDAVQSIVYTMRPNGCRVTLKREAA